MDNDKKSISISSKFYSIISTRIKNPVIGFESVDEYVDYILSEILENDENTNELKEKEIQKSDEEKTKKIEDKLRNLGYI